MDFEQEIFQGKTFSSLLKDIYDNSKAKEQQLRELIVQLKDMIQEVGDAVIVVPLLKEYMDVAVKNDEALIKMAAIVQKAMNATCNTNEDGFLSEKEKEQLYGEIKQLTSFTHGQN